MADLGERFWSKVDRRGPDECWEWQACREHFGHGRIGVNGGKMLAHRLSFQMAYGYLPPVVRHRCDNPPCVNPAHLEPGDHLDNIRDRQKRGRNVNRVGEEHGCARLTADQVRDIRARYAAGGLSQASLAAEFGMAPTAIGRIVRRETWAHVR